VANKPSPGVSNLQMILQLQHSSDYCKSAFKKHFTLVTVTEQQIDYRISSISSDALLIQTWSASKKIIIFSL